MEIKFVQNGERLIWVAYDVATGKTVGEIRYGEMWRGTGFQVWVQGPQHIIAQGQPHKTLEAAKHDLASFF